MDSSGLVATTATICHNLPQIAAAAAAAAAATGTPQRGSILVALQKVA